MKLRCAVCGAFISEKNRVMIGQTTVVLVQCKKCKAILSLCPGDCC